MSAPAAKARSEPVKTMTWIDSWDWKARRAALTSAMRGEHNALSALGRLRVTASINQLIINGKADSSDLDQHLAWVQRFQYTHKPSFWLLKMF